MSDQFRRRGAPFSIGGAGEAIRSGAYFDRIKNTLNGKSKCRYHLRQYRREFISGVSSAPRASRFAILRTIETNSTVIPLLGCVRAYSSAAPSVSSANSRRAEAAGKGFGADASGERNFISGRARLTSLRGGASSCESFGALVFVSYSRRRR